jgi:DNA topoisomerase I
VAPFITSTLQQESSRKLRFSVKRTMMLAQQLYEGVEARQRRRGRSHHLHAYRFHARFRRRLSRVRDFIGERFGREFLPDSPNVYKSKKDAQDAHEAVRPTSACARRMMVAKYPRRRRAQALPLIWMRFVASQMMPAVFDQTTIDVSAKGKERRRLLFRATGSAMKFDGFLKVYEEGKDQKDEEDEELKHKLPAVTEGES